MKLVRWSAGAMLRPSVLRVGHWWAALRGRPPDGVAVLSAALGLCAAILMIQTVLISFAAHSALPQEDEWSSLSVFRSVIGGAHVLADLFSQHNEHRILFPRLILFADYLFFAGGGYFDLTVIFATQFATTSLFLCLLHRLRPGARGNVAIGAVVVMLMFSLRQSENFVWGFQVQFVGVFAVASFAIVAFSAAIGRARAGGRAWGLTATALAMVGVATFSMSNGLLSGIVLVALALLGRAPLWQVVTAALVTGLLIAVFAFHYEFAGSAKLWSLWLQDPMLIPRFTAAYLGNFLDPDIDASIIAGGCGLVAMAWIAMRFALARDTDPTRLAPFGIALFAAFSADVTALGRAADGLGGAMASRYATGSACFWAALSVLGWSLAKNSRRSVVLRGLLSGAAAIMIWACIQQQAPNAIALQDRAFEWKTIENGLLLGLVDETALRAVDDPPASVRAMLPLLRERRLSIFATRDAELVGRSLAEAGVVRSAACPGSVDAAVSDTSLGRAGVRVKGTTGVPSVVPASRRIYIAGPDQTITGFASTPYDGDDWSGYATGVPGASINAFLRLGSGQLCAIGGSMVMPEMPTLGASAAP